MLIGAIDAKNKERTSLWLCKVLFERIDRIERLREMYSNITASLVATYNKYCTVGYKTIAMFGNFGLGGVWHLGVRVLLEIHQ